MLCAPDELLVVAQTTHVARVQQTILTQFCSAVLVACAHKRGVLVLAFPDVGRAPSPTPSSSAAATPARVAQFIHDNNFLRKVVIQAYAGSARLRVALTPLLVGRSGGLDRAPKQV